jgi:hypothetical protein
MALLTKVEYERAAANGIGVDALQSRVYCYGWDVEEAINTPIKKRSNIWEKWSQVAKENSVPCTTFYRRVAEGWEHERAASTPPMRVGRPKKVNH